MTANAGFHLLPAGYAGTGAVWHPADGSACMKNGGVMATIHQQIEVAADPAYVRSTWSRFIEWVHTGPGHLLCDQLACVDAVRSGLVRFAPAGNGGTTVAVDMERADGGPSPADLRRELGHDLVMFKDYVERSGRKLGKPTPLEEREMVAAQDRAQHRPAAERQSERDESVAYTDHFPT